MKDFPHQSIESFSAGSARSPDHQSELTVKALVRVTRSVLPAEAMQMALLFGIVFLFVSPALRWAPSGAFSAVSTRQIRIDAALGLCAIRLSATFGLFLCFRPGRNPVRRMFSWALLPSLLGIVVLSSIYSPGVAASKGLSSGAQALINSFVVPPVPGFHYALGGFLLIAIFTLAVAYGYASLPLTLPESSLRSFEDSTSWNRVEVFTWALLALIPTVHWIFPFFNFIYGLVQTHIPSFNNLASFSAEAVASDTVLIIVSLLVVGNAAWKDLQHSLCWPSLRWCGLGIAFPTIIAIALSLGQLSLGALQSTSHVTGMSGLSVIAYYFKLPNFGLLWLLPVALGEEILFRGILQPQFIRRYGVLRGILLVGIAFAAVHFGTDFSVGFTDGLVLLKLLLRLIESIGLSIVAGWLTIQSGSIIPAALAHGLMNILGSSPLGPNFFGIGPLTYILWLVLAWLLFKYWPIREGASPEFVKEGIEGGK